MLQKVFARLLAVSAAVLVYGTIGVADAYTDPKLKLPLPAGYAWQVNTEAGTGKSIAGFDSYHTGNGYYSIDFGRVMHDNTGGQKVFGPDEIPVLAAASGKIITLVDTCDDGDPVCKDDVLISGRTPCKIEIDHENGYVTQYLHFSRGSLAFTPADVQKGSRVRQGTFLGRMGNTGNSCGSAHLHFQVFYKDGTLNSRAGNSGLNGITLDGIDFLDHTSDGFKAGAFRFSTNGYTLPTESNPPNPHTCTNQPTGGKQGNGYKQSCNQANAFTTGQTVFGNLAITNVTHDFCWRADLWFNGKFKTLGWTWCSESSVENSSGGWMRSHLGPSFTPTEAGSYEIRFFVTTSATKLSTPNLDTYFLPAPLAVAPFTVSGTALPSPPPPPPPTPSTPYTYDNNAYSCSGQLHVPNAQPWIPGCENKTTAFTPGQTAYVIAHLNQVTVRHRYRMDVYKDDKLQWGWDDPFRWNEVKPGETWPYTYAWATVQNLTPGRWKVKFSVILDNSKPTDTIIIPDYFFTVAYPPSTPPYTYNQNNFVLCAGPVTGGDKTNYIYTCTNPKTSFVYGEAPTAMLYVENVTQNFRFYGEVKQNDGPGGFVYETPEQNGSSGWDRAYFWLTNATAAAGSWTHTLYIQPKNGARTLLKSVTFTVAGKQSTGRPFSYDGNGLMCKSQPTGGENTNWYYSCQNPTNTIFFNQTIFALVRITNVTMSHYFRVEAFRNNVYQWSWNTGNNTVYPGSPWTYSHFWPSLSNATYGSWRFDLYAHTADGNDYLLNKLYFNVL